MQISIALRRYFSALKFFVWLFIWSNQKFDQIFIFQGRANSASFSAFYVRFYLNAVLCYAPFFRKCFSSVMGFPIFLLPRFNHLDDFSGQNIFIVLSNLENLLVTKAERSTKRQLRLNGKSAGHIFCRKNRQLGRI